MADDLSEKMKKLKHNLVRLVEYQLAIEDYEDLSGDKTVYPSSKQATLVLNGIWRNEKVWDLDKRLDESEKALILFDKLTDEGKDYITRRIREDNQKKSERYYPLPQRKRSIYERKFGYSEC